MKGSYSQEDIYQMNEIEEVIRKIREIENDYQNRKKVSIYIDTYQKPSLFCKELLRECGLGSIQIIDTPGVSGNVEPERIVKSDMYIFLVKPDNSDEAQTLKKIVMQRKGDVATSKVAFLYKKEGLFFTKEKYEEAQNTVKNDMIAFSDLFSDLKGSIIATELDVLNPSSHCILFPTMGEEVSPPEELFLQAMREKLIEAFLPEDTDKETTYGSRLSTLQINSTKASNFILQAAMLYGAVVLMVICLTILSLQQLLDADQYKYRFSVLRKLGVEEPRIQKLVLKQLGVWFGLPVLVAVIVAAVVIAYFVQSISAEISAYIGVTALLLQAGTTVSILAGLFLCYFISTWILFSRSIHS